MVKAKTMDELGEDLCKHCPIEEGQRGAHCYGGEPVFCVDSGQCETAYDNYLESLEEEEVDPEATYTDDVGGFHDCGTGINPNGVDCGECSFITCKGCPNEHTKKEDR